MDWEALFVIVFDKLLLGVLLLVFGLWINRGLENYKSRLGEHAGIRERIAEGRLPSYRALWTLTRPVAVFKGDVITLQQRKMLYDHLCHWYYTSGNGLFLSNQSRELYERARDALVDEKVSNSAIQNQFSGLRTALKDEIGIYD